LSGRNAFISAFGYKENLFYKSEWVKKYRKAIPARMDFPLCLCAAGNLKTQGYYRKILNFIPERSQSNCIVFPVKKPKNI
jgi:hypothetical protein